ncbi:MAG: acyltransferase [Rhodospirillales bacterium]|nr:acyltransferase [Rhodospirillales bacterium]
MSPRPPKPKKQEFNRSVHGARGLFSSAVYVFHVVNSGLPTFSLLATPLALFGLRTTEFGVEAFFCISGFVISGALRRARSPASFLTDRAIRIFPVLWATILTIGLLGFVTRLEGFAGRSVGWFLLWLPANLLALPGFFHLPLYHPAAWSLSYEAMFYLACSGGWWLASRRGRATFWLGVPLACLVLALYPRAIYFLAGVIVAEGLIDGRWAAPFTRYPVAMLLAFLACWRGVQLLSRPTPLTMSTMFEWTHDMRLPLAVLAFAAATFGLAGLASGRGLFGRFLRLPVMQYLGTISYSFYLWHPIVMAGVKHEMMVTGVVRAVGPGAQAVFFVLALPPSLIVAHYSQIVLERGAGRWLRARLHHPAPLVVRAQAVHPTLTGVAPAGAEPLGAVAAVSGGGLDATAAAAAVAAAVTGGSDTAAAPFSGR